MSEVGMSEQHLLIERSGDIVTVTLNRPEKRNTLAIDVLRDLGRAMREIGESDARGVILAANGPVFSAGHNFADLYDVPLNDVRKLFQVCTDTMDMIQSIPQPVCAKVHALATAAGCQLVATCDLAVASDQASFAIPGGKGGLFCHTPLVAVARNVGRKRALEMAMTGDAIDAQTAADWGFVNKVVPADELDAATDDMIRRATRGSALSKGMGKQSFYSQIDLDQPKAYAYAIEIMSAGARTEDGQEGIASFLGKRKPNFRDR